MSQSSAVRPTAVLGSIRVSTEEQACDGISLDAQAAKEVCIRIGGDIAGTA